MADVRIQQYPLKSIVSDNDIFLIADSNDVDVNGFLKYKKVRAKDLPSIVNTAESITYANLMAAIAADDLIIGTFYKITDSTSGVSPLLVQAVGVDAIGYLAFDGTNPLVTINYDVMTDTIRWSLNQTVAPISLGSLSATTPLSYNNTTGVFTISQSNTTTNGYLSSADWNTFTAKQNAGNYITALTGEATASGPVKVPALNSRAFARCSPNLLRLRKVAPAPGGKPLATCRSPMRASSAITTKSAATKISKPPARANPLTAAITGTSSDSSRNKTL